MRRSIPIVLIALVLAALPGAGSTAPACQYTAGFQSLYEQIPDVVGDCPEDAHAEAATGNVLQRTTGGLLVWRARGNWTAFTNGGQTWLTGPFGLQQRGATERFDWEDGLGGSMPPPAPSAPPAAAGALAAPVPCTTGPLNDDPSRAAPLAAQVDGTMPPAIWRRSGSAPDKPIFLYYSFTAGANQWTYLGINVVDEGGYKVRANVYGPDGGWVGSALIGAHERQEIAFAAPQTGHYTLQLRASARPRCRFTWT